jgi:hypothetical protein
MVDFFFWWIMSNIGAKSGGRSMLLTKFNADEPL